jgi:hypothetical protein
MDTRADISLSDTNTSGKESKKVGIKSAFLLKVLNFRGLRKIFLKLLGIKGESNSRTIVTKG